MENVNNNTVDTVVNAAASAIVTAEARVQPTEPKKRWGRLWSKYWCFGSHKSSKKIGKAVLVPEPVALTGPNATTAPNTSTPIAIPFIAPPSSPASFLQSDPPSATHSPAGSLSLASLSVSDYPSDGPASIFAIGPYTYETQLVSPPVFSNFTTEPSTASFTPPPESVQQTTPSSPEVPFAQLLASSLDRAGKNRGTNHKFSLSNCEFQPYYPGSPGPQLVSPGSVISTSGSSTPFPDRHPVLEFRKGEAPKALGFEPFSTSKLSSGLGSGSGSGSWTPDGAGQGSRLGSGSLTPDGVELASQLGSGCLTPDGLGQDSRLGSGSLTPDVAGPTTKDVIYVEKQIPEVASHANSGNGCQSNTAPVDRRVSFEFTGEDVARCLANKSGQWLRNMSQSSQGIPVEDPVVRERIHIDSNSCDMCPREISNDKRVSDPGKGEEQHCQKHDSFSSSKEFNFDKKVVGKEGTSSQDWAFFPMLH